LIPSDPFSGSLKVHIKEGLGDRIRERKKGEKGIRR